MIMSNLRPDFDKLGCEILALGFISHPESEIHANDQFQKILTYFLG